jgi:hypothetical protein
MKIEVSIGEIVDKLTILDLKLRKILDESKLFNIRKEHDYLKEIITSDNTFDLSSDEYKKLFQINLKLWQIEDYIREKENEQDFGLEFISLARQVYKTNDERAKIKKDINLKYNSEFIEEKSYSKYN